MPSRIALHSMSLALMLAVAGAAGAQTRLSEPSATSLATPATNGPQVGTPGASVSRATLRTRTMAPRTMAPQTQRLIDYAQQHSARAAWPPSAHCD